MGLAPEDALRALPATLRDELLKEFNEIVTNYREHRWEPSELKGGKLCEIVFTIIKGWLDGGIYPAKGQKPQNFPKSCWELEKHYPKTATNHTARILIPRMMIGLYDIRNNRGVGHTGAEVNPNHMDATAVLYLAKWLVAELVRLLHTLPTDEATAIVDGLIEREVSWVWTDKDKKRVLRTGMKWKEQTLVLLLTEAGDVNEDDLFRWLEHPRITDLRKNVLIPMHAARQIDYDRTARTIRLLPPGVTAAEKIVSAF